MEILVIRHGQPHDESETGGVGDPSLSDLGRRQADAVADLLTRETIDHIIASPMKRAAETAHPLASRLGLEVELVEDLIEAGGWEAGPYLRGEENSHRFGELLAADPLYFYKPEGRDAFVERVSSAFDRIVAANAGRRVAVFCHGLVTTEFTARVAQIADPDPVYLSPDYAALTRVMASATRDRWSLVSFNETGHLRAGALLPH